MRIQALKNAAAIIEALEGGQLSRDALLARLEDKGLKLSKDSASNLFLDLMELAWIEKTDGGYRIGLGLALVYKRAVDAEKKAARQIMERLEELTGPESGRTEIE